MLCVCFANYSSRSAGICWLAVPRASKCTRLHKAQQRLCKRVTVRTLGANGVCFAYPFAQSTAVPVQTRDPSHFRCDGSCISLCIPAYTRQCSAEHCLCKRVLCSNLCRDSSAWRLRCERVPRARGTANQQTRSARSVCTRQLDCLCKRVSRRTLGATGAAFRCAHCTAYKQCNARLHRALQCLCKRVPARTLGASGVVLRWRIAAAMRACICAVSGFREHAEPRASKYANMSKIVHNFRHAKSVILS